MIYELVEAGRNLRAEARVPSNQKAKFALRTSDSQMQSEQPVIEHLLNASELIVNSKFKSAPGTPVATAAAGELFLIVEVDRTAERQRLDKEIAKIEEELRIVKAKLSNKSFVDRAPAAVVEEHRQRQKNFAEQLKKLKEAREKL
jgi:valyl-tRNA synthetase